MEKIKRTDGTIRYRVRVTVDNKRTYHSFDTAEQAKAYVDDIVSGRVRTIVANQHSKKIKIGRLVSDWIEQHDCGGSTKRAYLAAAKKLEGSEIETLFPADLTEEKFVKLLLEIAEAAPSVVNNVIIIVSNALTWAQNKKDQDFPSDVDFKKIYKRYSRDSEEEIHFFTQEEIPIVVDEAHKAAEEGKVLKWFPYLFELMLMTGPRASEASALMPENMNIDNGILHIKKTVAFDKNNKVYLKNGTKSVDRANLFVK